MANISFIVDGLFFGYIIALVLLGMIIIQAWIYAHDNDDRWNLRIFVAGLVLLVLSETICTTLLVHRYLISHFGDISTLMSFSALLSVDFTICDVTFLFVHLFFAHRLWRLNKSWLLPAVIILTSTAMLALSISENVEQNLRRLAYGDFQQHYIMAQLTTFHALAIVTDLFITIGLSWTLSTAHANFKPTRTVIQRLLIFTLTRGILVCLAQVAHIVMYFLHSKNPLFWVSLHLGLGKLYVITILVTLNSRSSLRDKLGDVNLNSSFFDFGSDKSGTTVDVEAAGDSRNPKQDKSIEASQ